jgi:ubiquinone biosynthesis protein
LTMDYVRGRKITEIGPLAQLSMEGEAIADQLFRAYLKQILVDGLFHADPHPGNVFLTNDYRLALLDLGMCGHLPPSMQEELLKLLLAVSEGRGDEATTIGLKIGEHVSEKEVSETALKHSVAQVLTERMTGELEGMHVGLALMDFSHICLEHGIRMPAELTMLGKTLLNLDTIGRTLDPKFDPNEAIRREAFRLTRERLEKSVTPAGLLSAAIEAKEFAIELPRRVNKILDMIVKNELTLQIDTFEEKTLIDGFQKVANRIATGLILAALIVGAAMLMRVDTTFKLFGYPGLAILCFFAAAIGGLWLLMGIALTDRRTRKE